MRADKITLEPTDDGRHWRVKSEGGDVEGHGVKGQFTIEPDGEDEQGEPFYNVRVDGEDVEGHGSRAWSDQRLKRAVTSLASALDAAKAIGGARS